jgi:hypothetical protein
MRQCDMRLAEVPGPIQTNRTLLEGPGRTPIGHGVNPPRRNCGTSRKSGGRMRRRSRSKRFRQPKAGDSRSPDARLPLSGPEALQRDARFDDRSGSAALSQRVGQGGQALLHGACVDGEPQPPYRRRLPDRGQWPRRADRGAAHDRAARRPAEADHARRRQGLRRRGLRQRTALDERDADVAQNTSGRSSAIDGRTTRHTAMRSANVSASGSRKPSAGSRRSPARSEPSSAAASASDGSFTFAAAAYNLARLPKLLEASA